MPVYTFKLNHTKLLVLLFESLINYTSNGWDDAGGNHLHFRVGVGYFLKTENSGWFKLTPTREIFDWEEE